MNRLNTIYYKFISEKKKYSINFSTTEISIADVKSEIIKRRNMDKVPEKFELIIFDENNNEIRDENYKVEPLRLLIIRRIPWYKLSSTFVEKIRDPSEISSLRFSDFVVSTRKIVVSSSLNMTDPLEKVGNKINQEILNKIFSCKSCNKIEEDLFMMNCCGFSVCEKCAQGKNCSCGEESKGYMPNKKIKEMKERLQSIVNKPMKSVSHGVTVNPNMTLAEDIQSQIIETNFVEPKNKLPPMTPIEGGIQLQETIFNPYSSFFENARFFIIKSSNKENVDLSQKYSEWATTVNNQKKLNEAFQSQNVILIFSINKSGNFQGYAIMTSFISDKVSSIWQNESSVRLGGSFSVQWLSICEMPFSKAKNLVNPLNNNECVIKSRDTQELTKEVGILLCNSCYEQEKFEITYRQVKPNVNENEMMTKVMEEIKINRESNLRKYKIRIPSTTKCNETVPNNGS
jgi:hypothetical protein